MNTKKLPKGMKIQVAREAHFFGFYKGFNVDVEKESSTDTFYIQVFGDKGTSYDGYWRKIGATMDDAVQEALRGI